MICRNCGATASIPFADLGVQPLANAYLTAEQLSEPETFYPLRPLICEQCRLVQLPVLAEPEQIFRHYAFFSSQSMTWLEHCERYVEQANQTGMILEIASNDGTLLRLFQRQGRHVLGIEPARNVAWRAQLNGIPTIAEFFGVNLACQLRDDRCRPDLIVANNVLAHVPDLDDFLAGIELLIAPEGAVTFELPHLIELIRTDAWDAIYHEHFSYFSLITASQALAARGLRIFDVEQLNIHGGSLRIHVCRRQSRAHQTRARPAQLMRAEQDHGYWNPATLAAYASQPPVAKARALALLATMRSQGKTIAGYGAPAKGNTWLNYLGIGPDILEFVVDSTPAKQGTYLPGSHIPVLAPEALIDRKPDVIVILPWNWRQEIEAKIHRDCDWQPQVLCRPGTALARSPFLTPISCAA